MTWVGTGETRYKAVLNRPMFQQPALPCYHRLKWEHLMSNAHTEYSSFRENVIEHLFIGRCLQELWKQKVFKAEVLRADVDGSGYDIVIEARNRLRHIQLKASFEGGATRQQKINVSLAAKPSGCVVWIVFDPDTLDFREFLWFGADPGSPLPSLDGFKTARHTKGDATGFKAERTGIKIVPRGRFEKIATLAELSGKLFG